jgi:hypothetical protein
MGELPVNSCHSARYTGAPLELLFWLHMEVDRSSGTKNDTTGPEAGLGPMGQPWPHLFLCSLAMTLSSGMWSKPSPLFHLPLPPDPSPFWKPSCSGAQVHRDGYLRETLSGFWVTTVLCHRTECVWSLDLPSPTARHHSWGEEQAGKGAGLAPEPLPCPRTARSCLFVQADKAGFSGLCLGTSKAHCSASFSWMGLELRPGWSGGGGAAGSWLCLHCLPLPCWVS